MNNALESRLVEFMAAQDRRAAHQDKCVSDMAKQVGKLARAVEGLCGALGPAVRDSITHTLGPQVHAVHQVAAEVRTAAEDMNNAVATLRQSGSSGSVESSGAQTKHDAGALAAALVPKIEAIVLQAFEGRQLVADAGAYATSMSRKSGGDTPHTSFKEPSVAPPLQQQHQHQAQPEPSYTSGAPAKGILPHQLRQRQLEDEQRAAQLRMQEEKQRQVLTQQQQSQQQQRAGGGGGEGSRAPVKLSDAEMKQIHSAIRWNKPLGELAAVVTGPDQANCVDDKNGNCPLHIASQNGFLQVCKLLVAKGAAVNVVNHKNNTPLHMALGYDYDECAAFLYSSGADGTVVNGEGYSAKNGLEGDKGPDGFVPPVSELREARTVEESMAAIRRIGTEGCGDKAALVQVGLLKKKNFPESWSPPVQAAFRELMMSLPRE